MEREKIALAIKIVYGLLVIGSGAAGVLGTVNKSSNLKIMDDDKATSLETYGYFSFCLLTTLGTCVLCYFFPLKPKPNNDESRLLLDDTPTPLRSTKNLFLFLILILIGSASISALGIANKTGALNNMDDRVADICKDMGLTTFFCTLLLTLTFCGLALRQSKNRYLLHNESHHNYSTHNNTPQLPIEGNFKTV